MRWKGLGNFSESQHISHWAIVWFLGQKSPDLLFQKQKGLMVPISQDTGVGRQSFPWGQNDSSYILTYEDQSPGTAS